jgi:hypothetical protein
MKIPVIKGIKPSVIEIRYNLFKPNVQKYLFMWN